MFMRLFFSFLFVISVKGQTDKIRFNPQDSLIYYFEQQQIVKKTIDGSSVDSTLLDPIPEKYPDYEPVWIDNTLHLGAKFGGHVYMTPSDWNHGIYRFDSLVSLKTHGRSSNSISSNGQ